MANGAGVNDTFRYKVELDTQGLATQLASVRDVVAQGLGQAARGVVGGAEVAAGAMNRISSDLMTGQQMLAAAIPAQFPISLPPGGVVSSTLANVPGMPQGMGQELMALAGATRAPVGVFPDQYRAVAAQRLNERVQMGAAGLGMGILGMGTGWAGSAIGGAIGTAILPVGGTAIGSIVGGIGGYMLGETVMAPFLGAMQDRMTDRARIQSIFGWNQFREDQRAQVTDFMRQRFTQSILDPESFNNVLPAAVKAGFFRGVTRGDVRGAQERFAQAETFFTEAQYALGTFGAEGIKMAGDLAMTYRRLGIRDPGRIGAQFRQAHVLGQQMREMGEYVDPTQIIEQQQQIGQAAMQMGVTPQRAMDLMASQSAMTNRLIQQNLLSEDDLALLGGTPGEAAQRLTMSVMATQRQPIFRAMALAFGAADAGGRGARINEAAMEQLGSGRISFAAMTERMSQQMGTGSGGATKMMTLMANQQKLQGDMLTNQGQMIRGLTDDILKQANLDVTDGTRMFMMQRVFGIGEAESRALVQGLPMEKATRERMVQESDKLDSEVKDAMQVANTGVARSFERTWREFKEAVAAPLDNILRSLSNQIAPPLEASRDRLTSIDERLRSTGYRANSPISSGPVQFGERYSEWMYPPDSSSSSIFRAVSESRMFPKPMVSMKVEPSRMGQMVRFSTPTETMAG